MDQELPQPNTEPNAQNTPTNDVEAYREHVRERLALLTPIFAKASVGDFTPTFEIPEAEDEFMNLYVGVWVMLEVIRAQLSELKELNKSLQQNITEIEEAKAKDEALLGSIGDAVIAIDKGERVIYLNEVAEKTFGWSSSETVGKSYNDIWEMQNENGATIPLSKHPVRLTLLSNQRLESNQYYYVRKDKTRFPASITISPIILNGQVEGVIIAVRDITKEKQIDRAKDEFISLASHQLRTPLTIIKWSSEKLLNKNTENLLPQQKEYLVDLYTTNQRMIELVNALLNVSRIELGTIMNQPEQVDIKVTAKSVLHELEPQIIKKKIELEEKYDEAEMLISADPKLVRIVLQNLLSNAVKYTPDAGKIGVEVSRYQNPEKPEVKTEEILLTISDNGCGIPQSEQSRIFSKMFRADNARKLDPDGNGLGLYIVKSTVEKLGGKIWFESQENKGTSFYVIIPKKGVPEEEVPLAVKSV